MRRILTIITVLAAVMPVGGFTATGATARALQPSHAAQPRERLSLVSGDRHWLLYTRTPVNSHGDVVSRDDDVLIARSRHGKERRLRPADPFGEPAPFWGYQVVGSTVSATTAETDTSTTVTLWNLSTGTRHSLEMPATATYLGTAPGGFLFVDGDGPDGGVILHREQADGTVTDLGEPIPGHDPRSEGEQMSSIASSRYAVISAGSVVPVALNFATGTYTPLENIRVVSLGNIACSAIFRARVACVSSDPDNPGAVKPRVAYAPIADKPAAVRRVGRFGGIALARRGASWIDGHHLRTMSLSGRTRTAAEPVDLPVAEAQTWGAAAEFNPETITSGFGRIVVARRHLRVLATTPTAARPFTRLLRAPRHASVRS